MSEAPPSAEIPDGGAPLFILSFRQRDELQALTIRAGWSAIAARRAEGIDQRFLASGAQVMVVDARGALAEGLAAAAALSGPVVASGAAMLVLVSRGDGGTLADFHDAGATHFLLSPHSEAELLQALRYAARHAERLTGRTSPLAPATAALTRDTLTGAGDGAYARRWLERRLERPGSGPVHAMLIALSRFDMVNSSYGRAAGDALLRAAYRRIADVTGEVLGRGAIVARMDGSEFLIATDAALDRVELAAATLNEVLTRPFVTGDTIAVVGCRIGIAGRIESDTPSVLLRRASEALAEAKGSDGATVKIARQDGPGLSIDTLAVDLRRGLEEDELQVLFQPQVAIGSGAIVGVEALVRWQHPRLGALGAETLLAAAERADLGIAVSDHIQRLALDRAARWPAILQGLRLSVNLTAADVARPGFADLFLDRVDASGFPRTRLTVEITEGGLIDDLGRAAQLFATLRAAGLHVAVDDFGTGYSSLAYLKALPLDTLKIDRRLAQDITGSPRDRVVVRGVIEMARSLGLAVVAEGVETEEQLDLLAKEGCNFYQGFLCAEPLTGEALVQLMEARA